MFNSSSHIVAVFFAKLVCNLKAEANKTYLNYIWWLLEPVLNVSIFYLVFSVFLNRGNDDFLLFLLCGKIPYLWFSKTVSNSSNSIVAGKGLIHQIRITKLFFPLLVVAQDCVKQTFVFGLLLLTLLWLGKELTLTWLYIIPIIFTQLLLIIACSLIAAAIVPFVPDFRFIIDTGLLLLMFGSGIFYSYKDVILQEHQELFLMNPLANLFKNYREVLLDGIAPDFNALMQISLISVLIILVMKFWFSKADSTYARLVIQ